MVFCSSCSGASSYVCSSDLICSSLILHSFANPRRRTTEARASFVKSYVQERLGPSCCNSGSLYSFTSLKFPPKYRTVHFTIYYLLGIAFIHPTSDPRWVSFFGILVFCGFSLNQLACVLMLPHCFRAISARPCPRMKLRARALIAASSLRRL
jgi:hypothetical protein